ncbi:MAG: tRNA 2-thiouridine(34) synthase MnmA [Desulfohalobiaceae bacterium]
MVLPDTENPEHTSIAVAVSGGGDSLMALRLLARQGRAAFALHARLVQPADPDLEMQLAQICHGLGLELQILDLRHSFQERIVQPFVQSYLQGETPNPCAWCNVRIKFGLLLQKARELGADSLATGHYARRQAGLIRRGLDSAKEQSYFLALLSRQQVARACLPLGQLTKQQVNASLREQGLVPPAGGESQEICFVPDNDYRGFLASQGAELPGPGRILDTSGKLLGWHQGLYRYTIGQRRGLGISFREPLYVLAKDPSRNELLAGPAHELSSSGFVLREPNFVLPRRDWPQQVWVQTNYRESTVQASLEEAGNQLRVIFRQERKPATPGQVAAFYNSEGLLLGGGIIHA